ncbi:hypothetical protein J3Q64DRAFT_1828417 [Phycomyces blakesleeanus]|uniref:mRNA cap guanine-N(7) methyltransferase n=1 Tax=Phycomyces blakesleeanus TaxID=4837 RepID=A0ABR3BET5_PHYBL
MKYASVIGDSIIRFYADYVGIKDRNELTTHLKRVQALLNENNQTYRCIDEFKFAYSRMCDRFFYPGLIEIGKTSSPLLIDLGCCAGVDLRKLMLDGYPVKSLVGVDLSARYIECGYELCRDKDKLPIRFLAGDIFDESFLSLHGQNNNNLNIYRHKASVVHAGSLIHLFHSTQRISQFLQRVCCMLLKGGLFVGAHVASNRTTSVYRPSRGHTKQYIGIDTFRSLLESHDFSNIEIQTSPRLSLEEEEEIDDISIFWVSFSAVYNPPSLKPLSPTVHTTIED